MDDIINLDEPNNPWQGTSLRQTVAKCDQCIIKADAKVVELGSLPEPYHGNPNANVYLLGCNPAAGPDDLGYAKMDAPICAYRNIYEKEICEELRGLNTGHLWLRDDEKVVDGKGTPYPAYRWWKDRCRCMRECLPSRLQGLLCDLVFAVEYFPYHTAKADATNAFTRLPSYDFSDELIYDAMTKCKIIVVMRSREKWFSRIKGLSTYPNLILLHNHQNTVVSPGNMLPFDWAKLVQNLQHNAVLLGIEKCII